MTSAPPEKLLYMRSRSRSLAKQGLNKGLGDIHTLNLKTRHCQVKTTEHSFYSSFHLICMHPTLIVGHIPIHYYWTYLERRMKWICTGEQHLCKWKDVQGQPYRGLCCLYLQRWVLMFTSENHCKEQKKIWCMSWLLAPQPPMASIAVSWMHFSAEPSHPSLVQDPIGVQTDQPHAMAG